MADQIPLRIIYVNGVPTIGEFQSGDTLGIEYGGTGVSSIAGLLNLIGINNLNLSSDLLDVAIGAPLASNPVVGDSLVWTGSYWSPSAVNVDIDLSSITDITISNPVNGETLVYFSSTGTWQNAVPIGGGSAVDHGLLTGLEDNDHPQYVLSATNSVLSSLVNSIEASTVALSSYIQSNSGDHSLLTNLDANDHPQYVLSSVFLASAIELSAQVELNEADILDIWEYLFINNPYWGGDLSAVDHSILSGLGDNDHPQYVLSATNQALSSLVTNVEGSTVDISSYIAANEAAWSTDNDTTDHTQLTNIGTNTHAQIDGHIADITKHFTVASIDHGSIAGLGDNDHPQYVLSSTNSALSSLVTSVEGSTVSLSGYIAANESTWSTDNDTTDHTQLTNIGTNTHAQIDTHIADSTIHFTEASIDHGSIAGLGDNDHPQYVLSSTNQALSSLVDDHTADISYVSGVVDDNTSLITSVEGSTVSLSSYIAANEGTWSTDNDTTDHTQLTNIGTNTHAQIDGHISDITKHFTVASIDHGSIAGLGDNDHPQYVLSSTNQALSSLVTSVEGSTVSLSGYIAANESSWAGGGALSGLTDTSISSPTTGQSLNWDGSSWVNTTPATGVTDHGLLTGLEDDDHPQYVLSATNQALSSLVTSVEGSTVSLSGYIAANESTWSTDNDTTDHTQLTNIGTNTHAQIDGHIADVTKHFTVASIDHGSIAGLGDNDHPQYVLSSTNQALSSLVTSVEGSTVSLSSYIAANEGMWSADADVSTLSGLGDVTFTDLLANQHLNWDGTNWINADNDRTEMRVRNGNASPMSRGDVIAIESAHNQNLVNVILADASQTSAMPALGILAQDLAVGEQGIAITFGKANGLNTSGFTEGTIVYVSPTTPGQVVNAKPSGVNELIQNVGIVMKSHQSNGVIKVTGIGRSNDIDNQTRETIQALSSLVTSVEGSTVSLSGYIAANESTWSTDNDTTDHTQLTNIGTNTHAQIDGHISDITKHFTVASIDHGSIAGLGDNDHPQYVLSSTNQALSSLVTSVEGSTVSLSAYISANEAMWSSDADVSTLSGLGDTSISSPTNGQSLNWNGTAWVNTTPTTGVTDHGLLTGLSDNDHPQYVLSSTNQALSSLVTSVEGSTVDISAYIAANETAWSTDNDTTDHTALTNIGTNTHAQIDSHIADSTIHFTEASIDHTNISNIGTNTHAQIDSHIASGSVHFTEASIDHGSIAGLGDNDHPQYVLSSTNNALSSLVTNIETSTVDLSSYIASNETTWSTDNDTTDHTALSNIGTNTHAQIDGHIADITKHFTVASIDHGSIAGLADNDHPQYVLSATNNALSSLVTSVETSTVNLSGYIAANETTWATDTDTTDHTALSNIGTNTHDQIDSHIADSTIHFTEASIDHGSIAGLGDNDHPQYVLSATNNDLSTLVTNIETSTVDISGYIAANETTWSTDNDTTDHTALSNIGTNTHAQIDSHIADSTIHFTEASIDHGSIAGLGDNDHPQYVLSATNNALSSLVTSVETSTVSLSSYIAANETTWSTDTDTTDHTALTNIGTNTHTQIDSHIADSSLHFTEASIDHGSIAGLGDNDHPQYVLSSTNNALSSLVTNVEGSTVSLSSYIAANESTWSTDNDTTDHTQLTNIGTNTHAQIDTHIADSTIHFTEASIDHTNITNIGTNTHAQIDTHISNHTTSANTWNGTYHTVFDNSGTWGTGGGTSDHGALTGLADNDHPQYVLSSTNLALSTLVQDTADVSSIFSGNITVTGTTATHIGTLGTTDAATFGLQSSGNTSIIAPSLILSATTAYQFRKNGSTTYTDTDFPQSCRNWNSTYNTVLNSSGSWGGGGGGISSGKVIVNTGTDNIDGTGALVPLDTDSGYPAWGSHATDFSYTGGNSYVTINTAGTYEVTFSVGFTSTVTRWNGILKIYTNSGGGTPNTWVGYGASKMGYLRNTSGHNESSLIITLPITVTAGTTVGGWVEREAASGTCTTVANETYMSITRLA